MAKPLIELKGKHAPISIIEVENRIEAFKALKQNEFEGGHISINESQDGSHGSLSLFSKRGKITKIIITW